VTSPPDPAADRGDDGCQVLEEKDFRSLLAREASRATRYQHFFSVWLIRADVTPTPQAEDIRQAVAGKIAELLRHTDVVGQIEGETAILLLHTTDADALHVAERIRSTLGRVAFPAGAGRSSQPITVSMGEACFPDDGSSHAALLSRARAHLDEATRRGGNQILDRGYCALIPLRQFHKRRGSRDKRFNNPLRHCDGCRPRSGNQCVLFGGAILRRSLDSDQQLSQCAALVGCQCDSLRSQVSQRLS
jgi:diguanylate cyclase (GGDEF)-like protein